MKTRMLAAVLALVLGLTAVGCGGQSKETTADTKATTESAANTAASDTTKAAEPSGGEQVTIRIGHSASEDNIYQVACEAFRDKLTELLGEDRVTVEIYPNASLGTQTQMIEMMQMGTLDAVAFGRHSQIDSRLDVLNLPFLFEDEAHMTKVLRGEEGTDIRKRIGECFENAGIVMLGMFEAGFRNITSTKEIKSLADLNGLLIRTPNTDILMDSFEAWGASPTPIDIGDLYTALQTNVVDAQENPYQLIYTNKYYEVCPYLCITNHSTICDQLQFSKVVFDGYPADVQDAIREAGEYACNVAGEENNKRNDSLLTELNQKMTVNEMPESDLDQMKQIAYDKVWTKYLEDDFSKALVDDIQALAK